ncbi:MAG: hypothetical protein LVQ95_03220 [Candidatus Micrarchaeales archaeon]|nr:hypothetical protein [Candidatus Micrarchaeales archaeon]
MEGRVDYKIGVIGRNLLVKGFDLVGIKESIIIEDDSEAEAAFRRLLDNEEIGLIIINERTSAAITDRKLREIIDTSLMPLVVEVPGYKEKEVVADILRRLVLRAVGIDIYGSIG